MGLDLKPGQNGASLVRGLTGKIPLLAEQTGGQVLLDASYTDAGKAPAGTLTGTSHMKLRNRRIEAERADAINGPRVENNDRASGRSMITHILKTHTLRF